MGAEQLDAYVIITPASFSVRGTNQGGGGIGILKLQQLFGSGSFLLHAAYIITVVDGKDYSYSGDMRAIPVDEATALGFMGGTSRLNSPNLPVPPAYWENPAAHKAAIRQMFEQLAAQSLPHTLRRANLTD